MKKVDLFEYDTSPTIDNEIIISFKVDGDDCEMKVPKKTLKDMLWLIDNQ